jgi:type VI secretion system protein ImpF
MAELTSQERLQPSLLDRLTDDQPSQTKESRDRRVLSLRRLRECVMRDLAWLLNAGNLNCVADFDGYPEVASSVVNYGLPDIAGNTASSVDISRLERALRQVIWDFEPRILRNTVRIKLLVDADQMNQNAMIFDIEGELWAQPVPIHLYLKTEIDLETGAVALRDHAGRVAS